MQIALFYYDGFAEFEVVLAGLLLNQHDLTTVALEQREYRSEERQRFCVDQTIAETDPAAIDLLIIPGGEPAPLFENQDLKRFIEALVAGNKKIGAICGGSELLAALGVLKGKRCTGNTRGVKPSDSAYPYYAEAVLSEDYVVVDGNIITAQGQAYAEFAVELARQMGVCKTQEDCDDALRWCKNIR